MTTFLKKIERAVHHQKYAASIKLMILSKPMLCVFEELMHICGSKDHAKLLERS